MLNDDQKILANQAIRDFRNGRVKKATLSFIGLIKLEPNNLVLQQNLGLCFVSQGKIKALLSLISWLQERDALILATIAYNAVKLDQEFLTQLLKNPPRLHYPNTPDGLVLENFFQCCLYDEAGEVKPPKLTLNNTDPIVVKRTGELLYNAGQIKGLKLLFRQYENLTSDLFINVSALALSNKDYSFALELCHEGLRTYKNNTKIITNLILANTELLDDKLLYDFLKNIKAEFPKNCGIMNNIASSLQRIGKHSEAILVMEDVCKLDDSLVGHILELANLYSKNGDFEKVAPLIPIIKTKAAQLTKPKLSLLHYIDEPELILSSVSPETTLGKRKPFSPAINKNRPAKVAFLSGDLVNHAVTKHMLPIMIRFAKKYNSKIASTHIISDEVGKILRSSGVEVQDLSSKKVSEQSSFLVNNHYDIVVDLTGATKNSSLPLHDRKKLGTRVVSMLGFPGTMGHENVDSILADEYLIPESYRTYYSENIIYKKGCFFPYAGRASRTVELDVRSVLQIPDDAICLFSPHKLQKLTIECLTDWISVLKNDVFLVMYVDDQIVRERILNIARKFGHERQLRFYSKLPGVTFEKLIGQMDLMLDTWPFVGGATSIDVIGNSKPILTYVGKSYHTRMTASMLYHCGLSDFIASDRKEYIVKLKKLLNEPEKLKKTASRLDRPEVKGIFDGDKYVRDLYVALVG